MGNYTLNNVLSVAENPNIGYCNAWLKVENNANRPLFAQASYITNFDDLNISLSANSLTIGGVQIKDDTTGLNADVIDVGGGASALRVISQDLEASEDDVTIGDRNGNFATINEPQSALNVYLTNVSAITSVVIDPQSTVNVDLIQSPKFDSFGRLRTSNPYTLFDSSHRFSDNGLWSTKTTVGGTATFNQNQGLVDLTLANTPGSGVIRETIRTFGYQPGKSLLVMSSFVLATATAALIQRVGYFNSDNGIYLEKNVGTLNIVRRSTSISPSTESISRSQWNGDKLDGSGPSGYILDDTKVQILWMDFEWLGSGTVRVGFMINGEFIVCHSFHHANEVPSTYIQTACLPIRYEIFAPFPSSVPRILKQICSTVICEGGYELRGQRYHIGLPFGSAKDLTLANTEYPVLSIRLRNTREHAIAILSNLQLLGATNNSNYQWKILDRGVSTGGSWVSAGGSVEYNLTPTGISSGNVVASGYFVGSNQGSVPISISKDDLFRFQLERDTLNGVNYEYILCISTDSAGADVYCGFEWEEVTR